MPTLTEHNRRVEAYLDDKPKRWANVACDSCEAEMIYLDDMILAAKVGAARRVICLGCGLQGRKLV